MLAGNNPVLGLPCILQTAVLPCSQTEIEFSAAVISPFLFTIARYVKRPSGFLPVLVSTHTAKTLKRLFSCQFPTSEQRKPGAIVALDCFGILLRSIPSRNADPQGSSLSIFFSETARHQIELKETAFQRAVEEWRLLAFLESHLTRQISVARQKPCRPPREVVL